MKDDEIVRAIMASIANCKFCNKSQDTVYGIIYKIKYIIWYLLLLLFSPKKEDESKRFAACMTPVNEIKIFEFAKIQNVYRFAKLNSSINSIRHNRSVLSNYGRMERVKISVNGLRFYFKYRVNFKGYYHFVLEYYAIARFLGDKEFTEYITPGMYDRYCTLFSYLGRAKGVKLIGVQDGAAIDIGVPNKLFCDEMYTFDEYEGKIIRSFITNADCKYIYTGFTSTIIWKKYNKRNKPLIAVASQDWFTEKTISLIETIITQQKEVCFDLVVYPHYREKKEQYDKICEKFPQIILCMNQRHLNIDLLITFYSTIVYDFWSVNPNLGIKCYRIKGFEPGYYGRNNVEVFDSMQELALSLEQITYKNNHGGT